jgi:hypothetical protein
MKTIAFSTALALTLLTFSCEKEPLEWSTTAEFRIDPKTERHFVELAPTGQAKQMTAEEATASGAQIAFVWEINEATNEVMLLSPDHDLVRQQHPGWEYDGQTEFRETDLDAEGVRDLADNGSREIMKNLFNNARPLEEPGLIYGKHDVGIVALMDRNLWCSIVYQVTYDNQGRILFITTVAVIWHP